MKQLSIIVLLFTFCLELGSADTSSPSADPILGTWNVVFNGFSEIYVFNNDGSFAVTASKVGQTLSFSGTYVDDGSKLTLTVKGGTTSTATYSISGSTMTISGTDAKGNNIGQVLSR